MAAVAGAKLLLQRLLQQNTAQAARHTLHPVSLHLLLLLLLLIILLLAVRAIRQAAHAAACFTAAFTARPVAAEHLLLLEFTVNLRR
jgi:hypothetical protein